VRDTVGRHGHARGRWTPPTEGRWVLRATYLGSAEAARSTSGGTHLVVADPLD
jgi:hypothetical protein